MSVVPRKPRVQTPGIYHVTSRGNDKQVIFDDVLRPVFLFELDLVARAFDWWIYGWALMSNHYHLVLEITDLGLADGMHRLNNWFAKASNARFGRINHCVGDRYSSSPIESDAHFYNALRYVLWNPVRAGVVAHPSASGWTSYRPSVGLEHAPRVLAVGRLLAYFGAKPATAYAALQAFVDAGHAGEKLR